MGLNSMGYRTDPGPQVVKLSLIKASGKVPQKELEAFVSSGKEPPRFRVRWDEQRQCYTLAQPSQEESAALAGLQYLGHNFVDVEVISEEGRRFTAVSVMEA